ncbi:MAG: hypothetical protein AB1633_04225, partial [Elusimicrobiota bacterium]
MAEKENVTDILAELKKVLKDLTKEKTEQEYAPRPVTMPQQPQGTQQPPVTQQPQPPVPTSVQPQPIQKEPVPVTPVAGVSVPVTQPAPPAPAVPASVPASPPAADSPQPVVQPPTPPPTLTTPVTIKQVIVAPAPPQPPGAPVQQVQAAPPAASPNAIRFAIYCTKGQVSEKDLFLKTLIDITKKTSKKPLEMEKIIDEEIDVFSVDWEQVIENIKTNGVSVVFLIHPETYDSVDLKNKFGAFKLFFEGIQASKVSKKITYVDLVIELMLAK